MEAFLGGIFGFALGMFATVGIIVALDGPPAFEAHCSYIGGSAIEDSDTADEYCLIDGRVVLTSDEFFEKVD